VGGGREGGILNISLFGGIETCYATERCFFGLFLPIFGVFGQTRVFGILPIFRIGDSQNRKFSIQNFDLSNQIYKFIL
jgi:hypothetical protein